MAQIPLADNAVIAPIQIGMIIKLGNVFGHTITETMAKAIISSAAASFIGRGVSQVLLGWIPGVGNAINTATAAGITEAIGWIAVKEFSSMKPEKKSSISIVTQKKEEQESNKEPEKENKDSSEKKKENWMDEVNEQLEEE